MKKELSMLSDDELMNVAGGFGEGGGASGSFASSTGTALNLIVYWSVQNNAGQKNTPEDLGGVSVISQKCRSC